MIRAHGFHKHDLSDALAEKHFGVMRERFLAVVADLIARDLLVEIACTGSAEQVALKPTEAGRQAADQFSSALSLGLRAMCSVLSDAWRRRNVRASRRRFEKGSPTSPNARRDFANHLAPAVRRSGDATPHR
jgi:hypothetical protein